MGVVYATSLYAHSVPVKGCVAVWTPHLGTPANLEDHGPALGARFGVLGEQLDRLDIVWVACVLFIRLFNLIALLTDVVFANLTLPPSREEPSALVDWTLAHKESLFTRGNLVGRRSVS